MASRQPELRCPRCGAPVELPDAAGDHAALLREEGSACLTLANALASLDRHDTHVTGLMVGIGGYGSMSPEIEEMALQLRRERERLEQEIAALRESLHHDPAPLPPLSVRQ